MMIVWKSSGRKENRMDFQTHMMQFVHHNRRLQMPTWPGMGMGVLPIVWAKRTEWIGTIIYVTPKSLHCHMLHEIEKWTSIKAHTIVGMRQQMPPPPVIIITPQTLRLRVRELCRIEPRFIITNCIKTGWDDVEKLCDGAARVCIFGHESNVIIRSILR